MYLKKSVDKLNGRSALHSTTSNLLIAMHLKKHIPFSDLILSLEGKIHHVDKQRTFWRLSGLTLIG